MFALPATHIFNLGEIVVSLIILTAGPKQLHVDTGSDVCGLLPFFVVGTGVVDGFAL